MEENNLKILILILSFQDSPYGELMQAQKDSWDSIDHPDCYTVYYTGGRVDGTKRIDHDMTWRETHYFDITNAYYYMGGKLKLALEQIKNLDYDFIFRTNSSSAINKSELIEFAKTLPKEKCYAGAEIKTNEGFSIVSGAGFFISPDLAQILADEIDTEFEKEEDYYVGSILNKHGIEVINDSSRIDVPEVIPEDIDLTSYHYRFKNGDRLNDANNMLLLHSKIINQ